jgi:hypothetical protein
MNYDQYYRYNAMLNNELAMRGAKTFGTVQRKQARLQRFLEVERRAQESRARLDQIRLEQQELVAQRGRQRAEEIERDSTLKTITMTLALYFLALLYVSLVSLKTNSFVAFK